MATGRGFTKEELERRRDKGLTHLVDQLASICGSILPKQFNRQQALDWLLAQQDIQNLIQQGFIAPQAIEAFVGSSKELLDIQKKARKIPELPSKLEVRFFEQWQLLIEPPDSKDDLPPEEQKSILEQYDILCDVLRIVVAATAQSISIVPPQREDSVNPKIDIFSSDFDVTAQKAPPEQPITEEEKQLKLHEYANSTLAELFKIANQQLRDPKKCALFKQNFDYKAGAIRVNALVTVADYIQIFAETEIVYSADPGEEFEKTHKAYVRQKDREAKIYPDQLVLSQQKLVDETQSFVSEMPHRFMAAKQTVIQQLVNSKNDAKQIQAEISQVSAVISSQLKNQQDDENAPDSAECDQGFLAQMARVRNSMSTANQACDAAELKQANLPVNDALLKRLLESSNDFNSLKEKATAIANQLAEFVRGQQSNLDEIAAKCQAASAAYGKGASVWTCLQRQIDDCRNKLTEFLTQKDQLKQQIKDEVEYLQQKITGVKSQIQEKWEQQLQDRLSDRCWVELYRKAVKEYEKDLLNDIQKLVSALKKNGEYPACLVTALACPVEKEDDLRQPCPVEKEDDLRQPSDDEVAKFFIERAFKHGVKLTPEREGPLLPAIRQELEKSPLLNITLEKYQFITQCESILAEHDANGNKIESCEAAALQKKSFLDELRKDSTRALLAQNRDTPFIRFAKACGMLVACIMGVACLGVGLGAVPLIFNRLYGTTGSRLRRNALADGEYKQEMPELQPRQNI